jgi:hypothetical protein
MDHQAKIMLSKEELRIVTDTEWILTKQELIKKVYSLFNAQVPVISRCFHETQTAPAEEWLRCIPKISRGENYRGLPYVILDYPALFSKENIFALRTMMWWGNFFSVTLVVSGMYKEMYASATGNYCLQYPDDFYLCVHHDAWQHHFEASNYIPFNQMNAAGVENEIKRKAFLKVALKFDLQQWNNMGSLLEAAYKKITGFL